jgi:WD40 repeat protein
MAAGLDEFDIFVWNIQTTKIVDILKSHTSNIVSLKFSPTKPILVSGNYYFFFKKKLLKKKKKRYY